MEVYFENNRLKILFEGRSAVSQNSLAELRDIINKELENPSNKCEPMATEDSDHSESASASASNKRPLNSDNENDGDDTNFIKPKKVGKTTLRQYISPDYSQTNKFAPLTTDETEETISPIDGNAEKGVASTNQTGNTNQSGSTELITDRETKNTTPITLIDKSKWTKLNQRINEKKISCPKASNTSKGVKIQPQTVEDYRSLRKLMEKEGYKYFTHPLKQERTLKVVIRGVMVETEEKQAAEDLAQQGYPVLKVTRMNGKNKQPAPLILVEIDRKYHSIYKISHLCGLVITVEPLKTNGSPIQCHRCQLYGHIQKNCTADYKCLKCAGKHGTHECSKPKTTAATCANCAGPHTANYHKCPKRPAIHASKTTDIKWNQIPLTPIPNLKDIIHQEKLKNQTKPTNKSPTNSSPEPNHSKKEKLALKIGLLFIDYCAKNPTELEKVAFSNSLQSILALVNE